MASLYYTENIIQALKLHFSDTIEFEQAIQCLITPDKSLMDNLHAINKELRKQNELKQDTMEIIVSRIRPIRYEYIVDGHEWIGYFIKIESIMDEELSDNDIIVILMEMDGVKQLTKLIKATRNNGTYTISKKELGEADTTSCGLNKQITINKLTSN
jgi:hypothetical protein